MTDDGDKPCPLSAAMCISMPWNVTRSNEALEEPLNHIIFSTRIVKELCRMVKKNADVLSTRFDVDYILKVCPVSNVLFRE